MDVNCFSQNTVVIIFNIRPMLSAAILADYYGYNSIITRGTRVRRMRRTELSADKIIRCKLRTLSEGRSASLLKPTDLIGVGSLHTPNEHNKSNLKGVG
jgi:hypothetical protein